MPRPASRQASLFSKLRNLFSSFEFGIVCVVLAFFTGGYFLIKSLIQAPEKFPEVVWEGQFDKSNFDFNFETPADHYEVDLSLWRPVDDRLRGMKVSAVRQIVTRQVVRSEGQNEYLFSLHTSGLKPDFVCLTHAFRFTKDYGREKPAQADKLRRYTARIDISREAIGTPFTIKFVIHSWNAFQGPQNQMFGVFAKPRTQKLEIDLTLPDDVRADSLKFEHYDTDRDTTLALNKHSVEYTEISSHRATITVAQPEFGDAYFIRWDK